VVHSGREVPGPCVSPCGFAQTGAPEGAKNASISHGYSDSRPVACNSYGPPWGGWGGKLLRCLAPDLLTRFVCCVSYYVFSLLAFSTMFPHHLSLCGGNCFFYWVFLGIPYRRFPASMGDGVRAAAAPPPGGAKPRGPPLGGGSGVTPPPLRGSCRDRRLVRHAPHAFAGGEECKGRTRQTGRRLRSPGQGCKSI